MDILDSKNTNNNLNKELNKEFEKENLNNLQLEEGIINNELEEIEKASNPNSQKGLISPSDTIIIPDKQAEKPFELNDHLFNFLNKLNFQDEGSENSKYCLTCKTFYDNNEFAHCEHEVLDNNRDLKNTEIINELFEKIEEKFFVEFVNDLDKFEGSLIKQIETSVKKTTKLLEDLKKKKHEDIKKFRGNHKINFANLKKDFFELKFKFSQFYKKNDEFLKSNNAYANPNLNATNLNTTNSQINNNNISKSKDMNCTNINQTTMLNASKIPGKKETKEGKILREVFCLINYDLNSQIDQTEKKLQNYLGSEKEKLKSQADELEKIFNQFSTQIIDLKENRQLKDENSEVQLDFIDKNFPNFTHCMNLRLKKYSDILDKINVTINDIKNPKTYKKIEGYIGNLEPDIFFKMAEKNNLNFGKSTYNLFANVDKKNLPEMDLKNIVDNFDYLDTEEPMNPKSTKNGKGKNINFKSMSDTKNLDKKDSLKYKTNDASDFELFTEEIEKEKSKRVNNMKNSSNTKNNNSNNNSNIKHKKTTSLNFKDLDLNNTGSIISNNNTSKAGGGNLNVTNYNNTMNTTMLNKSTFWKQKEDLIKKYMILSLMGTCDDIRTIEEETQQGNFEEYDKAVCNTNYITTAKDPVVANVIASTNEILIYDKKTFTMTRNKVRLDRDLHGIDAFLDGCRTALANDKLYITGGRDAYTEYNIVLEYDYKENKIKSVTPMKQKRAYHTLVFDQVIMKLFAIGGENNKTCEELDLYRGHWESLPDLNVPRAYTNCFLNKNHKNLYCFFGVKDEITKDNYSPCVEVLNFDKIERGWIKIDYTNKCDINLRCRYVQVFPIEMDKLLMVGSGISRYNTMNFAIYDMKLDDLTKLSSKYIGIIRKRSLNDPNLKKVLVDINKSMLLK